MNHLGAREKGAEVGHPTRLQVAPVWPVATLAGTQLIDAALCAVPVGFVTQCLDDVRFPRRYHWTIAPIKASGAAGLLAGLIVPGLGALTSGALVTYFSVAVAMHLRVGDIGRNMYSACGLLAGSAAVGGRFLTYRDKRR